MVSEKIGQTWYDLLGTTGIKLSGGNLGMNTTYEGLSNKELLDEYGVMIRYIEAEYGFAITDNRQEKLDSIHVEMLKRLEARKKL